jgi:hypothetical protein
MSRNPITKVNVNGYEIFTYHSEAITLFEWKTMIAKNTDGTVKSAPYFIRESSDPAREDSAFTLIASSCNGPVGMLYAWHLDPDYRDEKALFFVLRAS